jgi:hypothetical protein
MSSITIIVLIVIALVSSGLLFVILKWLGVIGTAAVAEVEEIAESDETKPR